MMTKLQRCRHLILILGAIGLGISGVFVPSAAAPVDGAGDAIQINADDAAVVTNNSGILTVGLESEQGVGVPVNAHFTFGDPDNPTDSYAFTVHNTDTTTHTIGFRYDVTSDGNERENVQFTVYDSHGAQVGVFSEVVGLTVEGIKSGQTLFVVLAVDTYGLTSSADLSGTVRILAR